MSGLGIAKAHGLKTCLDDTGLAITRWMSWVKGFAAFKKNGNYIFDSPRYPG